MSRRRALRAAGHAIRLILFALAAFYALRFFLDVVTTRGFGPAAVFGLFLITGAIALVWRASVDFRKALRRLRT